MSGSDPAFPSDHLPKGVYRKLGTGNDTEITFEKPKGMDIRTYLSAKAMAAMIDSATHWDGQGDDAEIAKYAVEFADALISELNKP